MESGRPQCVHFRANRRQKSHPFGSHQQSEHTRDPEPQTSGLPAALTIIEQQPVRAEVQGQMNRFRLATPQPGFHYMRSRALRNWNDSDPIGNLNAL